MFGLSEEVIEEFTKKASSDLSVNLEHMEVLFLLFLFLPHVQKPLVYRPFSWQIQNFY